MTAEVKDLAFVEYQDPEINAKWSKAFANWLGGKAENTRRSYQTAWEELLDFTGKMPWEIGSSDIEDYVNSLRQGYSDSTIQQRLAAISSFYSYARDKYMDIVDGIQVPLYHYNPAKAVSRPKVEPYGKANPLNLDQVKAFLGAIDIQTVQGKRDYALLLAYIATGRRNTEMRTLTWGQIENDGHNFWYRWQGKGNSGKYELPATVFHAICDFLSAADRLHEMNSSSYIFTALSDHANRLPGVQHNPDRPLSARYIRDLVKKYARQAGLDPEKIRVHDLRHTAAMLRQAAGDRYEAIGSLLGHKSPKTTMIYLHRVGGRPDPSWRTVADMLGV